ncbi:MAG: PAS domain-containing protein, partial [Syntrophomonas sp.]
MTKQQLADSELVSRLHGLNAIGNSDSLEKSYASAIDSHERILINLNPMHDESELVDIIIPVMVNIYKSLKGSGFQVLLTDENGLVIEHFPPQETTMFNNWNEDILGINAIGTAIKIKKPIQISGVEHYRNELASLTSSAVPIFDQQGIPIAVLALIGPNQQDHSHVLSMLQKAVTIIVYKWRVVQKNRQLLAYNNYLRNTINIMNDGIIIVTETGIIKLANPAAARILGKTAQELSGTSLGTICKSHT